MGTTFEYGRYVEADRNFKGPWCTPLKLHCATRALRAGKFLRWVADQLGHADPAFTLRTYAHLMPEEESNLSFAEFGVGVNEKRVAIGAPKRPYTAPTEIEPFEESPNPLIPMARREGFASQ